MASSSGVFHLQIISPAAMVLDAHVHSAQIPGSEGDFGVLPRHAHFFSMIRPGVIEVEMADGYRQQFFAASGYADVTPEGCTILSDHIQSLADISPQEAQAALDAAEAAYAKAITDAERTKAQQLLTAAQALVAAVASC